MTSQFTIFSSGDVGAPSLTGTSGSLISLLDAVLVNGYGTKQPLKWTKPIPNDSSSCFACYKQPSGSLMTLFVNDGGITGSTGVREAFATGWEYLLGFTSSVSPTVGSGNGQFPLASQVFPTISSGGIPSGSVFWRKSNTIDITARQWVIFGDAYTFYMFIQTGDVAGYYHACWFGDIFSLKLTPDYYKCLIHGKVASGTATPSRFEAADKIVSLSSAGQLLSSFVTRTAGGGAGSVYVAFIGDIGKTSSAGVLNNAGGTIAGSPMVGIVTAANPTDNSLYLSPIWVGEPSNLSLRGRLRGIWQICHPITSFTDGQVIAGGNEYAGKTFQIVIRGNTDGMWAVETSSTVETNELP